MEFLKRLFIVTLIGVFDSVLSIAQDNSAILGAFEKSYLYEYSGDYSKAIDALKNVYDEESYEINLRLGWLTYMGGFFTESTAYYQKSIELRPLSIEAKFGFVYPASALGNWEQVKKHYNEILKIDSQNTLANYRLGSFYYGNDWS